MIYYRSAASNGRTLSLSTLRILIAVALIGYPAGGLMVIFGQDYTSIYHLLGLVVILLAVSSAAPVVGSRLQRIVGEQPSKLDEMELQQRHKAMSGAYMTFTALFLAAIAYAGVASDVGWWVPAGYENWNALFWGVFLYSALLPTAFVAWTMPEERD